MLLEVAPSFGSNEWVSDLGRLEGYSTYALVRQSSRSRLRHRAALCSNALPALLGERAQFTLVALREEFRNRVARHFEVL